MTTIPNPSATTGVRTTATGTARSGSVLLHVVRSELLKALSLRSMVIALGVAVFLVVVLGTVMTLGAVSEAMPADEGAPATLDAAMGGISVAVYAVATFGVLAVTGEYATGTIRSTVAAVPRRRALVLGKAIAVGAVTLAVTLPATLAVSFAARVLLSTGDLPVLPLLDTARVAAGAALYLTAAALLGSGFAWLVRSTAGALAALVGLLAVVPALAQLLPPAVAERVVPFLPTAGDAVYQAAPAIGPWAGLGVFAMYAVVALVGGSVLLRHRDV